MTKFVPENIACYIVCNSHRAREKAQRLIGQDRQAFNLSFTDHDMNHKGIYPVTTEELGPCLLIKGVRKLPPHKTLFLNPCWSFN